MAQKVQVILIDDVDGGSADETVQFSIDNVDYELDLSSDNAAKFRDAIAPWVASARKAGPRRGRGRGRAAGATTRPRNDTSAVRDWAREQGMKVSDRGRIPADILSKYQAAHG